MIKKIKIDGVRIDSIIAMKNEVLSGLKFNFNRNASFHDNMEAFISKNKIERLDIIWDFFSISLLKMRSNMFEQKKEDYVLGNGNNMLFQALNDILISGEELSKIDAEEKAIKQNIAHSFEHLDKVNIIYQN